MYKKHEDEIHSIQKKMFYKLSLILSYKPKFAKFTQYLITMIKKGQ